MTSGHRTRHLRSPCLKSLLCFVHGQGQKREQKPTTKKFVGFHNHSRPLTMLRTTMASDSLSCECHFYTHRGRDFHGARIHSPLFNKNRIFGGKWHGREATSGRWDSLAGSCIASVLHFSKTSKNLEDMQP